MQYNCINMIGLENGNKILFSKVLRNCTDLKLFEVEPIQIIIDYKWDTYGFDFFKYKFMIYVLFMILNILEEGPANTTGNELEIRLSPLNLTIKSICLTIQMFFLIYEIS